MRVGRKPGQGVEIERICRYCGRTAKSQFIQMADGQWRCKSPDYCQRRTRKTVGVSQLISTVLQGGETGLSALASDRTARQIVEALSREGYTVNLT
jgi:hypothetical protein